jgi:hypothetical protein
MLSITMLEINRQGIIFLVIDLEAHYQGIMLPVILQEPISQGFTPRRSRRLRARRARQNLRVKGVIHQ